MAEQYSYGVTSIELGDINATTKAGENYATVGSVNKDTCKMNMTDATITKHFSETKKHPLITVVEDGDVSLEFSLMDTSADNLVKFLGGTASDVADAADFWSSPDAHVNIEKALRITSKSGHVFEFQRCKIVAKIRAEFSQKGVFFVDVMAYVLDPESDAIPAVKITDGVITNVS